MSEEQPNNSWDEPVPDNTPNPSLSEGNNEVTNNNVNPSDEQSATNKPQNQNSKAEAILVEVKKQKWSVSDTINSVIALGTVVALIIAFKSFNLTKESVADANKSSEFIKQAMINESRAYLVFDKVEIIKAVADSALIVQGAFMNVGKTPAYKIKGDIFLEFNVLEDSVRVDTTNNMTDSIVTVTSGSNQKHFLSITYNDIYTKKIDKIWQEKRTMLFVIMKLTYYDIYGNFHYTHGFMFYDSDRKDFMVCRRFNDAN